MKLTPKLNNHSGLTPSAPAKKQTNSEFLLSVRGAIGGALVAIANGTKGFLARFVGQDDAWDFSKYK